MYSDAGFHRAVWFLPPGGADSPYATKTDVWYDEAGIRSIQVVFPGRAFRCGDTGGSGTQRHVSHTFGAADKLISVDAWSGTAARGSLAGLRLRMTSGVVNFGRAGTTSVAPDMTGDAGGASAVCGLFGSTVKSGSRTYLASLGFYVRGGNVPQAVPDHLNDNRRHYSQAVWANADELTLSRILAHCSSTPAGSDVTPVLLGTLLPPLPDAVLPAGRAAPRGLGPHGFSPRGLGPRRSAWRRRPCWPGSRCRRTSRRRR